MSRERLLANLRSVHGVRNDRELMNVLQDCGHVSDEAVEISDVADGDLVRAWNKCVEQEMEAA